VSLVDQGFAEQSDIAKAFGCSARTVRRHQRRFEEGGLAALGRSGGLPCWTLSAAALSRATGESPQKRGCIGHSAGRRRDFVEFEGRLPGAARAWSAEDRHPEAWRMD